MNVLIPVVLAVCVVAAVVYGLGALERYERRSRPLPEIDPAERGEPEFAELADDADDGHSARAVETRLTHDAHLRPQMERDPAVRQPLAIEAAPEVQLCMHGRGRDCLDCTHIWPIRGGAS